MEYTLRQIVLRKRNPQRCDSILGCSEAEDADTACAAPSARPPARARRGYPVQLGASAESAVISRVCSRPKYNGSDSRRKDVTAVISPYKRIVD